MLVVYKIWYNFSVFCKLNCRMVSMDWQTTIIWYGLTKLPRYKLTGSCQFVNNSNLNRSQVLWCISWTVVEALILSLSTKIRLNGWKTQLQRCTPSFSHCQPLPSFTYQRESLLHANSCPHLSALQSLSLSLQYGISGNVQERSLQWHTKRYSFTSDKAQS